jgi:hypothetical protein
MRRVSYIRSSARGALVALIAALAGLACVACAPPRTVANPQTPPSPRFYFGDSIGSEAQFNPVTEILNDGYDVLRGNAQDRHVFTRGYVEPADNVWHSLMHADRTFRYYGYGNALRNEWLPLTTDNGHGGGAWVPNYEYHLIGDGMVSVRLDEWFEAHDVPLPGVWSFATMMSAHYLNEIVENGASSVPNEDATTDLLFFDLGGIALWRSDAVQRAFSGALQLTNWPGQPSIDVPSGTLEDARQQFVLRAPLPFTTHWKAFYDFGLSTLLGVSRTFDDGDAWSAGFGVDAVDNPVVDPRTDAKTATLRFKGGLFYDRRGSLLGSLLVGSRNDVAAVDLDLYPGVLHVGPLHPGLWLQMPRAGGLRVGITSRWGIGIGHGPEN